MNNLEIIGGLLFWILAIFGAFNVYVWYKVWKNNAK